MKHFWTCREEIDHAELVEEDRNRGWSFSAAQLRG
jgi:hypothetical protein